MTPVAYAVAKQATIKARKRKQVYCYDTKQNVEPSAIVSDIHCFECTEVFDLAVDLADSGRLNEVLDERIFLPAPKTWIEHKDENGRQAWLLTEKPLRMRLVLDRGDSFIIANADLSGRSEESHLLLGLVLAMLAIINAPHIVYRDTFDPHRGLNRLWEKRFHHAPLNAWHELKLRVAKPVEIEDCEPHAAHIGGQRALHFCRAHLRIRLGRLEFVTSHWRGDAALGTKLTRYRVAK